LTDADKADSNKRWKQLRVGWSGVLGGQARNQKEVFLIVLKVRIKKYVLHSTNSKINVGSYRPTTAVNTNIPINVLIHREVHLIKSLRFLYAEIF
jgi:hypothetical protein